MPAASSRDIRCWTGNFRKSEQSTGKCRSSHLGRSAQSVHSSSPDPFRRTKELPSADCIFSRPFQVTMFTRRAAVRVFSARRLPLPPLVAAPGTPRPAPPSVTSPLKTGGWKLPQLPGYLQERHSLLVWPTVFSPLVRICLGPSPRLVYIGCLLPSCLQPSAAQLQSDRSNARTPTAAPLVIRPARCISAAPLILSVSASQSLITS